MKKTTRKIIAFLLAILLFSNCIGIIAQEQEYGDAGELTPEHLEEKEAFDKALADNPIIKPFWLYTIEASAGLHINSGVATCNYNITATTSVTKISNYVYLQRLNTSTLLWVNEKSWSKSHDDHSAVAEFKYTLSKLGLYRTKLYAHVYKGSPYEEITSYSTQRGWA